MDPICPAIFYFLSYSDHCESTYLFSLSFTACCSGWTRYIQSFSISSGTRITVSLLIYFPFLYFLLFWMDTICPVIFYFLCYSDHSVSTYLFSISFPTCCSGWTLYIQSFSISTATQFTVFYLFISPLLYFLLFWLDTIYPGILYFLCYMDNSESTCLFPISFTSCCSGWTLMSSRFLIPLQLRFPAALYGHYRSNHFLLPLLLGAQWVNLFISPFLYFLLFWMHTICGVIFYCLCYSDHSESTYLFSLYFTSCCSGWTLYGQSFSISSAFRITMCPLIYFPFPLLPAVPDGPYMSSHFLIPLVLGSQCFFSLSFTSCCSGWTLYVQSFSIS